MFINKKVSINVIKAKKMFHDIVQLTIVNGVFFFVLINLCLAPSKTINFYNFTKYKKNRVVMGPCAVNRFAHANRRPLTKG